MSGPTETKEDAEIRELEGDLLKSTQDLLKTKQELVEVRDVLAWASENVQCMSGKASGLEQWGVAWGGNIFTTAPTLYEALKKAWEARDTTKDL